MPEGPATAKTIAQLSITTVTTQSRATKLETISESRKRQRTGPTRPLTSILRCHDRISTSTTAYNIIIQQQQSLIIHFPHENNINTPGLRQNMPKTDFPALHDTIPAPKRGAPPSTTSPAAQPTSLDSKNAAGRLYLRMYSLGKKIVKNEQNSYIYRRAGRHRLTDCHVSPIRLATSPGSRVQVFFPEFLQL